MLERLATVFFTVIWLSWTFAQSPSYINYGVKDGLPSEEVYDIAVDESGLIWCTTDRGVCTYDGYSFTTYTSKDGLVDNTNFEIIEDREGKYWFTGINGNLSYYHQGTFHAFEKNDEPYLLGEGRWVIDLFNDKNQLLFIKFNLSNGFVSYDLNSGILSERSIEKADWIYESEELGEFIVKQFDDQKLIHQSFLGYSKAVIELNDQQGFLGLIRDKLYHFHNGRVILFPDTKNKSSDFILKDEFDNIWIGTNEGLLQYPLGDLSAAPLTYFDDISVTSIAIDRDQNYWISSLESGLFFIPSFGIKSATIPSVQKNKANYLFLSSLDEVLLVGSSDYPMGTNILYREAGQAIHSRHVISPYHMLRANKNDLRKLVDYRVATPSGKSKKVLSTDAFILPMIWINSDTLLLSNFKGYIAESRSKRIFKSSGTVNPTMLGHERVKTWALSGHDAIWAGTMNGLFRLSKSDFQTTEYFGDRHELLSKRISTIIPSEDDKLWIGTVGNGLLYFDMDTVLQYSVSDQLSSNMINSLEPQGDSILWVATNKGLDKLIYHWEGELPITDTIINYTTHNGLLSNYVNYVEWHQDELWVAFNNGLNYFDPEELERPAAVPIVLLTSILSITDDQKIEENQELLHNQSDIVFSYKAISFAKPAKDPFYRYKLHGPQQTNDWYYSNDTTARFTNLAAGAYEFRVEAQNKHHVWSKQPAVFQFEIAPHFSKTWWFYTLILFALASLIGWLWRWRLQDVKKDQKLKEAQYRTKDAELSALRNQMNPHFVFNSLNSIQNYIFKNEIENANYYLSQFSKLMRNSLEFSKLKNIALEDEIQFLILYMELELHRFPNTFDFRLTVDPRIATDIYYLPPLILQPIIENSVKYAFKHAEYKGLIEVDIQELRHGELIKVIIQDNGSGLKSNSSRSATDTDQHKSFGLSIVKNRIDLLNAERKNGKASFQYTNRTDRSGLKTTFVLPIKIHNDKISNR